MMIINKEECIGCGQCVKDCFLQDIEIINGKAEFKNITCIKCGHCIAVCPKNAVSTDEYNIKEVKEYDKELFAIEPEHLLNFIKFRRTVRQFKKKEVENEKIKKIIEAGRYTQTGSNSQNVSYIVVKEDLEGLKDLTLKSLKKIGENMLVNSHPDSKRFKRYAQMWIDMYHEYKENPDGHDRLFFHAPVIIVVTADNGINGALASSNMELMTNALGLGTFFSGFFVKGAQGNKEIMDLLGINEDREIVTCMVIGYPDVKYQRTAPRKEANICWK